MQAQKPQSLQKCLPVIDDKRYQNLCAKIDINITRIKTQTW